ncbi:MAG: chloride channel protein [Sandaracinaceae bacterium]|nr:chloride channel protein [Sandaracinaceae bacterium]
MAGKHFEKLDDEARALHDSWDSIVRIVLLVAMLSVVVWAGVTALRMSVHWALDHVVELGSERSWVGALVLLGVLVAAGVIRGLLMRRESWRDAAGDGMSLALENYHVTYDHAGDDPQPRYARPAFALAGKKFVATLLTVGSGASGGIEAPVVMMGESLSAGFARVLAVRSEHELRTYQLAGIAAAVSALLGAPFTAALFATEIAYGDRIIYRKLAYALWAGVIAFWLNTWLRGSYVPLFVGPAHAPEYSIRELGGAALVAVMVSVPVAFGFGKAMIYIEELITKRVRASWHAVVSSLAVGLVALALLYGTGLSPAHVLGMGEHTISELLDGSTELTAWWMLLLVLLGKTITTGLTLAGGGKRGAARSVHVPRRRLRRAGRAPREPDGLGPARSRALRGGGRRLLARGRGRRPARRHRARLRGLRQVLRPARHPRLRRDLPPHAQVQDLPRAAQLADARRRRDGRRAPTPRPRRSPRAGRGAAARRRRSVAPRERAARHLPLALGSCPGPAPPPAPVWRSPTHA